MSRVIKFRAWDGEKMSTPFDAADVATNYDNGYFLGNDMEVDILKNDIVLMQFTGLHDKNGKEIYEGDILYHEPYGNLFGKDGVYWNEQMASFCLTNRSGLPLGSWLGPALDMEIIGNVYENPELLKV